MSPSPRVLHQGGGENTSTRTERSARLTRPLVFKQAELGTKMTTSSAPTRAEGSAASVLALMEAVGVRDERTVARTGRLQTTRKQVSL